MLCSFVKAQSHTITNNFYFINDIPNTLLLYQFILFPTIIKSRYAEISLLQNIENKNRSAATGLISDDGAPFLFAKRWKSGIFPTQKHLAAPHGKSYCPYKEKPPQAVSSPILNPNSCVFWNGGKDSAGRTPPPPGNSAYRNGHSLCRACYTGVCRSRPGRTPIPDAISCSGS